MNDPVPLPCECPPQTKPTTPQFLDNAPGQGALAARVGDHGAFLDSLLAAAARAPQLDDLTVRDSDDFTVGVLDAWAVALDVLTFYQERIANEGYLGTAIERRSVLELARTIGYELAPGVATEAHLAFTLDSANGQAGTPGLATALALGAGIAAQSIPQAGQLPATYETVAQIEARPAWNAIGARLTEAQPLGTGTTGIWLDGLQGGLKRGDRILLVGGKRRRDATSDAWDVRPIDVVVLDVARNQTHVTWREKLGSARRKVEAAAGDETLEVWLLGASARPFGATAPDVRSLHETIRGPDGYGIAATATEWPDLELGKVPGAKLDGNGAGGSIQIDGALPLVRGDWLVLQTPDYDEIYDVMDAAESAARAFTLTAKTTLATLRGENLRPKFNTRVRDTTIWRATQRFALGEAPAAPTVDGDQVALERIVDGLAIGHTVAVSEALPPPAPLGAPPVIVAPGQILRIAAVAHGTDSTVITFDQPLARAYPRARFRLHANVVRATHGLSREEVLGSGNAGLAFQTFKLSDMPLTYISAETPSGRASTLEIRINRLLWREVDSFLGQPADARIYTVRRADDGTVTIIFGDGKHGARLPSGAENVVARYRVGVGTTGQVVDRQIAMLLDRPLGLAGVMNPAPSTGGANPEDRVAARASAPGTVTALGRIVSLPDFEDFALGFAGIAKARAAHLWTGHGWLAHLTVTSASGEALPPGHPLLQTLRRAIDAARDITQSFRIDDHRPCKIRLVLKLLEAPQYRFEHVRDALTAALATALGRASQHLAKPITASEIMALAHAVPGVAAIDIVAISDDHGNVLTDGGLVASPARVSGTDILPADLLLLDSLSIDRMPT